MITAVDDFLTPEQIDEYKRLIDEKGTQTNRIHPKKAVVEEFWLRHQDALRAIGVIKIFNQISLSNNTTHLNWHKDPVFGDETHKILIYLNELPSGGGTLFRMPDGSIRHENAVAGRLVMFDIRLEHAGEPFPTGCAKYTIGFRAGVQNRS